MVLGIAQNTEHKHGPCPKEVTLVSCSLYQPLPRKINLLNYIISVSCFAIKHQYILNIIIRQQDEHFTEIHCLTGLVLAMELHCLVPSPPVCRPPAVMLEGMTGWCGHERIPHSEGEFKHLCSRLDYKTGRSM